MLCVQGHYKYFPLSVRGIDFRRQNLTSMDVRFYGRQILTSKVGLRAKGVLIAKRLADVAVMFGQLRRRTAGWYSRIKTASNFALKILNLFSKTW